MDGFRGNCPTRVDEKGRLKLPADFKSALEGGGQADGDVKHVFYITSKTGKRAQVWPLAEWKKVEASLAAMPNSNPAKQKFLDRTSYYGQVVEMDGQGRLLIPQLLRESASIGAKAAADVVVFGKIDYFEVTNREAFEAELKANPFTDEDDASLSQYGI